VQQCLSCEVVSEKSPEKWNHDKVNICLKVETRSRERERKTLNRSNESASVQAIVSTD